jgi:hypothetical protein
MRILVVLLQFILGVVTIGVLEARDSAPTPEELRQEEFLLRKQLRPLLIDTLLDQFVDLSVGVRYVLHHEPIIADPSKVRHFILPGFGTQMTIADEKDAISGYVNTYQRYRMVTLVVRNRLFPSVEEGLRRMMSVEVDLNLDNRDQLNVLVLSGEDRPPVPEAMPLDKEQQAQKEDVDKLIDKIDTERKEQQDRLSRLFPDLQQPLEPIDSRREAEASKHLVLSKQAYHNNDLNQALNEVIEAININFYASKSYEMLGSIYYRLKWHNLALRNWEKALALDPDNRKLSRFIDKVKSEL